MADFGFLETLGELNVSVGPAIHKFVLKNHMYEVLRKHPQRLLEHLRDALHRHMPGKTGRVDALKTTRKVMLEGLITLFIGREVIRQDAGFVDDFMAYQDRVENATAKAITLPRWLATLLVLEPTRRMRIPLTARLEHLVQQCWAEEQAAACPEAIPSELDGGKWGIWTRSLRGMVRTADSSQQHGAAAEGMRLTALDAASLMVGLLFAGHKNPAIGAAQTLLFLLENQADLALARSEADCAASQVRRRILLLLLLLLLLWVVTFESSFHSPLPQTQTLSGVCSGASSQGGNAHGEVRHRVSAYCSSHARGHSESCFARGLCRDLGGWEALRHSVRELHWRVALDAKP